MGATFPDRHTVDTVLALTAYAPRLFSSPPWRWQADADHLHLFADPPVPQYDSGSRGLLLSCGAALQHCIVGLAASGWQSHVRRLPDPAQPDLLATVTMRPASVNTSDIGLAAAIGFRHSEQWVARETQIRDGDIAMMGARAARAGVMLRQLDSSTFHTDPSCEATVLALGTKHDSAMARLRAGEVTSLVLLTATTLGLTAAPICEALEVAESRRTLREEVFGGIGHPQMLLRVGAPVSAVVGGARPLL